GIQRLLPERRRNGERADGGLRLVRGVLDVRVPSVVPLILDHDLAIAVAVERVSEHRDAIGRAPAPERERASGADAPEVELGASRGCEDLARGKTERVEEGRDRVALGDQALRLDERRCSRTDELVGGDGRWGGSDDP